MCAQSRCFLFPFPLYIWERFLHRKVERKWNDPFPIGNMKFYDLFCNYQQLYSLSDCSLDLQCITLKLCIFITISPLDYKLYESLSVPLSCQSKCLLDLSDCGGMTISVLNNWADKEFMTSGSWFLNRADMHECARACSHISNQDKKQIGFNIFRMPVASIRGYRLLGWGLECK